MTEHTSYFKTCTLRLEAAWRSGFHS